MSTPDNTPEVPEPPRYGQRLPEGQAPGGQPGQYGQQGSAAPSSYGHYGQVPPVGPSPYGEPGQAYGYQQPMPGSAGFGEPSEPLVRPKELDISFWLILAAGVLTLLSGLALLLIPGMAESIIEQAMAQDPATRAQLEEAGFDTAAMVPVVKAIGMVAIILSAAIYALIAFFIRKGSNGARITGTVFAAVSLFGLAGAATGDWTGVITVLLGAAGIVFAWLKPSSAYIAARKAQKHGGYGGYGR